MQVIENVSQIKKKLFDGVEQELVNQIFSIAFNNETIECKLEDFYGSSFESLSKELDNHSVNILLQEGNINKQEGLLTIYKGSDGLRLYYYKTGKEIVIFAYGEYQPSRYKVYIEGVWEIKD